MVDVFGFHVSRGKEILFKTQLDLCRISWDIITCHMILVLKETSREQGPPSASGGAGLTNCNSTEGYKGICTYSSGDEVSTTSACPPQSRYLPGFV